MIARSKIAVLAIAVLGLGAVAAPALSQDLFFDDFESGGLGHSQNNVRWAGGNSSSVSTDIARSGRYSLRFNFEAASAGDDSFAERRFSLGRDYTDIYIEFYAYFPDGSEGLGARYSHRNDSGPDNNKFFRLWKGDTSDGNDGYSQYYIKGGASTLPSSGGASNLLGEYGWDRAGVGAGPGDAPNAASASNLISSNELGRWVKFRVRGKAATNGQNDGAIEVWRDDVRLASTTNLPWYSHNGRTSAFNFGYLLGWANSGFSSNTNIYIDDVRISTSAPTTTTRTPRAPTNLVAE